jgi:hypothetical protein
MVIIAWLQFALPPKPVAYKAALLVNKTSQGIVEMVSDVGQTDTFVRPLLPTLKP